MAMQKNRLAGTSLDVSKICFGCGRLASLSASGSTREAAKTVAEAYEKGINFFDTADSYGQGRCEEILGRALGARRQQVVIATKAGYRFGGAANLGSRLKPLLRPLIQRASWLRKSVQRTAGAQRHQDFSPAYLTTAIDASLRRLKTDYIDLFLLHSPDPELVEGGEWRDALERAKSAGRIRFYGISCRGSSDIDACIRDPKLSCAQIPLNQIEPVMNSKLTRAAERSLGILARQPLASGLLAKPVSELRAKDFSFNPEEFASRLALIRELKTPRNSAESCLQESLQWVLQLTGVGSVILGMSTRQHLLRNLAAVNAASAATTRSGV